MFFFEGSVFVLDEFLDGLFVGVRVLLFDLLGDLDGCAAVFVFHNFFRGGESRFVRLGGDGEKYGQSGADLLEAVADISANGYLVVR